MTENTRPAVTVEPCIRFGEPHIRGVSVDALASMVWAGETVDRVARDYECTRSEVIVACWFAARHGIPTWRKRWRGWLLEVSDAMRHSNYDDIPYPPSELEASE